MWVQLLGRGQFKPFQGVQWIAVMIMAGHVPEGEEKFHWLSSWEKMEIANSGT